eukprot:662763_1
MSVSTPYDYNCEAFSQIQSTDYNLAMMKDGADWDNGLHYDMNRYINVDSNSIWGKGNSNWGDTIPHYAPYNEAVVGFKWDIVPSWHCEEKGGGGDASGTNSYSHDRYFHYHLSGFTTLYTTGQSNPIDIRSKMGSASTLHSATAQCNAGFAASAIRFGYHDFGKNTFDSFKQYPQSYAGTVFSR